MEFLDEKRYLGNLGRDFVPPQIMSDSSATEYAQSSPEAGPSRSSQSVGEIAVYGAVKHPEPSPRDRVMGNTNTLHYTPDRSREGFTPY